MQFLKTSILLLFVASSYAKNQCTKGRFTNKVGINGNNNNNNNTGDNNGFNLVGNNNNNTGSGNNNYNNNNFNVKDSFNGAVFNGGDVFNGGSIITIDNSPISSIGKGKFDVGSSQDITVTFRGPVEMHINVTEGEKADFPYDVQFSDSTKKVEDILVFKVKQGDTSKVEFRVETVPNLSFTGRLRIYSTLVVPKGGIKSLSLHTSSGDLVYDNTQISIPKLILGTTSANMKALKWKATDTVIGTTSGNADIDGESTTFQASTTSGNIKGKVKSVSRIDVQATSGDVKLDIDPQAVSKTTLQTTSGTLELNYSKTFSGKFSVTSNGGSSSAKGPDVKLDSSDSNDSNSNGRKSRKSRDKPVSGNVRQGTSTIEGTSTTGTINLSFD